MTAENGSPWVQYTDESPVRAAGRAGELPLPTHSPKHRVQRQLQPQLECTTWIVESTVTHSVACCQRSQRAARRCAWPS